MFWILWILSDAGKFSRLGALGARRKEGIVPIGGAKRALRDRQLRAMPSWIVSANWCEAWRDDL